jgi:hypothetical protein
VVRLKKKANYIGAPAIFILESACQQINKAFGGKCYLVGSAIQCADWRDIDIRFIMEDNEFANLFPDAGQHWEQDIRWLLLTILISKELSKCCGHPVDFQFQPRTHANERHNGPRHALGMVMTPQSDLGKILDSEWGEMVHERISDATVSETPK